MAVDYVYRLDQPHVPGYVLDPAVHVSVTEAVAEAARAEGLARPERAPAGL
ncbi:MAG: hypothetical protein AABM29_11440 [Actinomycetota bacterium]